MISDQQLRAGLGAALTGAGTALAVADRLCQACVGLLEVDGASISLTLDGTNRGTFGSSGDLSRRLDALQFTVSRGEEDAWTQLAALDRVEVYQATGMIVAALDVEAAEALVRLRAYAYSRDLTAAEVAWQIVERRLSLDGPDWRDPPQPQDPSHEQTAGEHSQPREELTSPRGMHAKLCGRGFR